MTLKQTVNKLYICSYLSKIFKFEYESDSLLLISVRLLDDASCPTIRQFIVTCLSSKRRSMSVG